MQWADSRFSELHFSAQCCCRVIAACPPVYSVCRRRTEEQADFKFTSAALSGSRQDICSFCCCFSWGEEVEASIASHRAAAGVLAGLECLRPSPFVPGCLASRSWSICLYFFFRTRYLSPWDKQRQIAQYVKNTVMWVRLVFHTITRLSYSK